MSERAFAQCPRVYLVGAHATGKTTLARWVRDRFGLPMISEVARRVLAEMEVPIEALRANLHLVNEFQARVFEGQIAAEAAQDGAFVSDRAFCNIAYAAHHSTILPEIAADARLARYIDSVREGVVFFLRPHKELLANDGVREMPSWDDVLRVDGMVKLLLELFSIPYVQIDCLSMQERVRLIDRALGLAGLQPKKANKLYLRAADAPKPVPDPPARSN